MSEITSLVAVTGKIGKEDVYFGTGLDADAFTVTGYDGSSVARIKLPHLTAGNYSVIKGRYYVSNAAAITNHGNPATVGSLAYLVALIGATNTTVELPGNTTYVIGTNLTIPSTIELVFQKGAVLSVSAGVTLTISGVAYVGATTVSSISGTTVNFSNGAATIIYEASSILAVSQFTFSDRARFYISMDASGDFGNDKHAWGLRVEAKYDYPSWSLGAGYTGNTIEMSLDNELNNSTIELGMAYGWCYALTADSKAGMHGFGADMVKQTPCTTSNTMIGHTSLLSSDVDPTSSYHGCGFRAHCSPLAGYSAVRQYAAFLADGTRGWKYSFLHYDIDETTVLAWIDQYGGFYSAKNYRVEAASAPCLWLEEGTSKGIQIQNVAGVLQICRYATAFGAYEGKPFVMNMSAPDWSFSMKSGGNVAMGQETPDASALLHLVSTTKGFIPPSMTTTQRDAIGTPAEGLVIYNATTHKLNVRVASAWEAVTSA